VKALTMLSLCLIWTALCAAQTGSPRQQIERAYLRSSKAMALKFADGVASVRAPEYVLVDTDGVRSDLQLERSRLEQLFASCTLLVEDVTIEEFSASARGRVRCKVRYLTRLDTIAGKDIRPLLLDTDCIDEWVSTPDGWLLARTRVLRQELKSVRPK
jgi:hypothetical protein